MNQQTSNQETPEQGLLSKIYAIFTDVRLDVENKQPAKVYAENADKIMQLFATHYKAREAEVNDNTLDQILYHLARRVQQNEPLELDSVKAQIIQMVMEIIGSDEYESNATEYWRPAKIISELRKEQRASARKYGLEIEE